MSRISKISPHAAPIAHAVHRLMVERKMNPTALSIAAGLGKDYVRDLFRGQSQNPKHQELKLLASALGVDISSLAQQNAVASDEVSHDQPYSPSEIGLIVLWRLLSEEGRDAALTVIAKLVASHPNRG